MGKWPLAVTLCLLVLSGKAFAGWYQVKNYEGSIGPNPVHLSLQRYDGFGSGITVEGSYFYDAKQSPIALYGKAEGTRRDNTNSDYAGNACYRGTLPRQNERSRS